jgi:uridylate kinase
LTRASTYRRILLKLSGEALMGNDAFGINRPVLGRIVGEIREAAATGVQIGLVVGGGNYFRGASADEMNRATADTIGMCATIMNALTLREALERAGVPAVAQSALPIGGEAENWSRPAALAHLAAGRVVVFGGGTGSPFFTTDTAACLRALEIGADIVLKATKVDGVYDRDPAKHQDAVRYPRVTYDEALAKRLGVMDATALALCREQNLPLRVFSLNKPGSIQRIVRGEDEGTLVERGD